MIFPKKSSDLKKALDDANAELLSIQHEYDVIAAEAQLYEKHGEAYEAFKAVFVPARKQQLAAERMAADPKDHDGNLMLIGAYKEWEQVDHRRSEVLLRQDEILIRKAKVLNTIGTLQAEFQKSVDYEKRKVTS